MTLRRVPDGPAGRADAIAALRSGGIVALPTDTVYGIGVSLDTPGGIERLFAAKSMRGQHAAIEAWQQKTGQVVVSVNIEKDEGEFCCIALTGPIEMHGPSRDGSFHVKSAPSARGSLV